MAHESRSVDLEPAQRASALPIRLGALASAQYGVVTHGQLLALGFSASAIQRACAAGRLHRRHHGVYVVGHTAIRREGHWLAAVLACGSGAALSHRSAAALWDVRASSRAGVEVTAALRGRVSPRGVRLRGTARLDAHEVTEHAGVPVTTVSRTLADLAAVLRPRDLERAFERAEALHLLDARSVLGSVRCRPGAPAVRRILDAWEPTATRSELEVALLRVVLGSGLPRPAVNARVGAFEVDLLWRDARLVVEADSIEFHLTRAAMERDRRRDAVLARDGHRVLRFTHRQVSRRPNEVTTAIRAALHGSVTLEPAQRA
jgi:very-short-patch-repair endonuclease